MRLPLPRCLTNRGEGHVFWGDPVSPAYLPPPCGHHAPGTSRTDGRAGADGDGVADAMVSRKWTRTNAWWNGTHVVEAHGARSGRCVTRGVRSRGEGPCRCEVDDACILAVFEGAAERRVHQTVRMSLHVSHNPRFLREHKGADGLEREATVEEEESVPAVRVCGNRNALSRQ